MVTADREQALRAAWAALAQHPPRARRFRTIRLSPDLALDAHAALRAADDAPCLIIEVAAPTDASFEVGGMKLAAAAGDTGFLLVLSLEDRERTDLFTTICADALSAASAPEADGLSFFLARLHAWRHFLRERRTGLSRREVVGLMGELVVLRRLVGQDALLVSTWTGPDRGLHDFARAGHALEVKSTLGPSAVLGISSIDQLDTTGVCRLDMLHVRMVEASNGESLGDLIGSITKRLPDERSRLDFENALLRAGLMPDDTAARSLPRADVREVTAYAVAGEFPRLVRSVVPAAVADVKYKLELRAIGQHMVDVDAALAEFAEDRPVE